MPTVAPEDQKAVMRAIIFNRYGAPTEVMQLVTDREVPRPKESEVLIKIDRASVNAADVHMVRADYLIVRLVLGLLKPAKKNRILGMDVAGTVQSVGKKVTGFLIGDEVAADIRKSFGGGFPEYVAVNVDDLVKKPAGVSFDQASTVPISGQAAIMGITLCALQPGEKVLIRGASGGVGSFGIQIAKALGAHVTAICSSQKSDAVRSWGADEIVNYEQTSIEDLKTNTYSAVLDTACFGSPGEFAKIMKQDGRYVLVGGNYYNMLRVKLFGRRYARGTQTFRSLTQEVTVNENIRKVFAMIENGLVEPAIQETVALCDVPLAISRLERRSVVGKIVVKIAL